MDIVDPFSSYVLTCPIVVTGYSEQSMLGLCSESFKVVLVIGLKPMEIITSVKDSTD
jgi:hypothetical protein